MPVSGVPDHPEDFFGLPEDFFGLALAWREAGGMSRQASVSNHSREPLLAARQRRQNPPGVRAVMNLKLDGKTAIKPTTTTPQIDHKSITNRPKTTTNAPQTKPS